MAREPLRLNSQDKPFSAFAMSRTPGIPRPRRRRTPAGSEKIAKVLEEFKRGNLHSGSKTGPLVRSKGQALAIALNQPRRR